MVIAITPTAGIGDHPQTLGDRDRARHATIGDAGDVVLKVRRPAD
jgi:hypothetical protein